MITISEEIKIKFYNENEKLSSKKKFIIIFLSIYYFQILSAFYS